MSKPSPQPVHLDVPRPKREISHESDTDSDYSPPTTIRKPHKGTTFAEGKKTGHHKQLSLYSWLSSPPTTSPPTSQTKATAEGGPELKTVEQIKGKREYLKVPKATRVAPFGISSLLSSLLLAGRYLREVAIFGEQKLLNNAGAILSFFDPFNIK